MSRRAILGFLVFLGLVCSPCWAAEVSVNCGLGQSLQSAVNSLPQEETNKVTVSGTCTQQLFIFGFRNLTIEGTAGATLADPGGAFRAMVGIFGSRSVTFRNLRLRGTAPAEGNSGVFVFGVGGELTIDNCLVDNFVTRLPFAAITAFNDGGVSVRASTIQDNSIGISMLGTGRLALGETFGEQTPTVIQRNNWGIFVAAESAAALFGSTKLVNNKAGAVVSGHFFLCCDEGQRTVADNQYGIVIEGGRLDSFGSNVIQRNSTVGVFLVGAFAHIDTGTTIQANGNFASSGVGGVLATNNSRVEIVGPKINGNNGSGVILTDGSSARIFGAEINNNAGDGVRIRDLAVLRLEGNTILGNTKFSLSCSKESHASGDLTNAGKASCPSFIPSSEPALKLPPVPTP